jgi:cytoskeletal protein CcmA (bactofilin family)
MLKTYLRTMKQNPEKQDSEEISVFWGQNSLFEGKMTSEGIFRLDGKVEGEIFHGGTLIIGETAIIKGKVQVKALILNGTLEGEVTAKERVQIDSRGKLYGTIFTPIFVIEDGGIFEGNCRMRAKSDIESNFEVEGEVVSTNSKS